MKDYINNFRKGSKHLDADHKKSAKPHHDKHKDKDTHKKNAEVELAKEMINAYRKEYADVDLNVLRNLIELKDIVAEPKKDSPDESLKEIQLRLGEAESNETLKQERWRQKISCPSCGSNKIYRLTLDEELEHDNMRYECKECGKYFSDQTGTPLEKGTPPLSTWMLCWYLVGCTDSLQYIASKLGLDLGTVELMVRQMQKLFRAEQPLTHFMSFEEWSLKHGKSYKQRIQHEMSKKKQLHGHDTIEQPTDTAEYRKQKTRARHEHHTTPNRPKPRNRST